VLGFLINLPCGAIVAISLVFVTIPDCRVKGDEMQSVLQKLRRLDLIGFSLFTPTMIQFILALQWGGIKLSWNSATVIGLFCGAFGNLLIFLAWEYHMGDEAMIPFSLMKRRIIWSSKLFSPRNISYFGYLWSITAQMRLRIGYSRIIISTLKLDLRRQY